MNRILIIDDEPGIRSVLRDILEDEKYKVFTAEDGFEGLEIMKQEPIELVLLDVWLPNMGGIDVLREIKTRNPETEVIVISGHANIDIAVKAVKLGAYDFLEKPLSLEKVITQVRNAIELQVLKRENRNLKRLVTEDRMIGSGKAMRQVRELIDQSAESDARILILGENGTGKELVARETRAGGPFVEVNCAAIPDTLLESELFGHEKGAFTSAVARRKGKFEVAHTGTLFLDEVADMSLPAQAKVLRVIQELRFERVGGEESISVDVRLISATNKDIQEEIRGGRFREDLYFRLAVIPIRVPALRERIDDLEELASYFMTRFRKPGEEHDKSFAPDAMEFLKSYHWPGNVREFKNFMERINVMTDEDVISVETVKYYLGEQKEEKRPSALNEFADMKLNDAKDLFEKKFLVEKLRENEYNITKTAQILGIYPSNLHGKIKKFGIELMR